MRFEDIIPSATAADEARKIADYFAAVKPNEALPALCVADPTMFPDLVSAFEAKGMRLHNPATVRLVTSSLGRLVAQMADLRRTRSYDVFSSFIRGGDVRRWLKANILGKGGLPIDDAALVQAFEDLDHRQAELLPETVDDISSKTTGTLRMIFEFVLKEIRKKDLRGMLRSIFSGFILDERDESAREFAAAAKLVCKIIDDCEAYGNDELFAQLLDEAVYSLEPDEGDAIVADGWMELPFVEADEIIIAGFQEGCVPESTVGHAYLPDSLRTKLGLTDNASRYRRDLAIFRSVVSARAPGAVKVFFHSIDANGDVLKPSRLLFEDTDDSELRRRALAFYASKAGTAEECLASLPDAWRLNLEIPPQYEELQFSSPSSIDRYLCCPFNYYLTKKFGDKPFDDRAEELQSWEYGNFAHDALEKWGMSDLKDSTDAAEIADFLTHQVDLALGERFGTSMPVIVSMQGESIKRRLRNFAEIQAKRRLDGWQVVATEMKLHVKYGHTTVKGRCDRIDYNAARSVWCVIDYKTWDTLPEKNDSVQLPLYCAMLDALPDAPFADAHRDHIESCYCIIGKDRENVLFTAHTTGDALPEAEKRIASAIDGIEKGIFWPPAPDARWQYAYKDWMFGFRPELSVCEAWIKDQEARLPHE